LEFDLGTEGAFSYFSIVAGLFFGSVFDTWETYAGGALNRKGFRVVKTND
jgi:hypothetical protein